jgi:hypothetical protein
MRQVLMIGLRRTWPVRLSRTKWPRVVKRIWGAVAAGGVLPVAAAVDDPGPLQGADDEGGGDVAFDVGDASN